MPDIPHAIKINESALIQEVSGEMVILDVESGQYYTLNSMASEMLAMLRDGLNTLGVIDKICEEYEVSAEEVKADLGEMLAVLLEKRLVSAGL